MYRNIVLSKKKLKNLPNKLPESVNNFDISYNNLTTIKGSPKKVNGFFKCSDNHLTSLKGSPIEVNGHFDCSDNFLTDLIGSPAVGGWFCCNSNHLSSLFGLSKIIKKSLHIIKNPNLLDVSDIWNSDIGSINFDFNSRMALLPLVKFKIYKSHHDNNPKNLYEIHFRNQGSSKLNILNFQFDLMEHGFEDNARWKPQ